MKKLILILLLPFFSASAFGASCCGGSGSSAITIPKFMPEVVKVSVSNEQYDGYWNQKGQVLPDPAGSDLSQTRMSFGLAKRLNPNLQGSLATSWVKNDNLYF